MLCVGILAGSIYQDIIENLDLIADISFGWENALGGTHRSITHLINAIGVPLPFFLIMFLLDKVVSFNTTWIGVLGIAMAGGIILSMILDILKIKNYAIERIFRIVVISCLLYGAIRLWTIKL